MLIDFSFANHRSFRDEQAFSMSRDERFLSESDDRENADGGGKATTPGNVRSVSPVAAIYGANASGKSNFLNAIRAMRDMVTTSYTHGGAVSSIPREPFLLRHDPRSADSTFFAEFIANDGQRYQYWFEFDDHAILSEHLQFFKDLDGRPSTHTSLLFTRDGESIKFGAAFKGPRAQVRSTIALRPDALLLSAAAAAGIRSVMPAFAFFAEEIADYESDAFTAERPRLLEEYKCGSQLARDVTQLVRYADFGIEDVKSTPLADFPMPARQAVAHSGGTSEPDQGIGEYANAPQAPVELRFIHTGEDATADFGVENESQGTLAAMSFFLLALRQLSTQTLTLVDEIDTSLHPTLVAELVKLYTDPLTNPCGSQLIFTTHDVSLIDQSGVADRLLEPDQVWLVEKARDGASDIFPVTDMGIRKRDNIGKNYLNGVYGASPKPSFHTAFARIMDRKAGSS